MTTSFETITLSTLPAARMFDRAHDIDAHTVSQARADERAVGGTVAGLIGLGEEVTWSARHFGVRFTMTSAVTEFDAPRSFVDEQVRGPFRAFRHEHHFESTDVGSVMVDRVTFTAPFGIVGRLAERAVLARYLRALIEERGRFLARDPAFSAGGGES